jgi:hypothetical protein
MANLFLDRTETASHMVPGRVTYPVSNRTIIKLKLSTMSLSSLPSSDRPHESALVVPIPSLVDHIDRLPSTL